MGYPVRLIHDHPAGSLGLVVGICQHLADIPSTPCAVTGKFVATKTTAVSGQGNYANGLAVDVRRAMRHAQVPHKAQSNQIMIALVHIGPRRSTIVHACMQWRSTILFTWSTDFISFGSAAGPRQMDHVRHDSLRHDVVVLDGTHYIMQQGPQT